jgi:hypothetical protein
VVSWEHENRVKDQQEVNSGKHHTHLAKKAMFQIRWEEEDAQQLFHHE